MPLRNDWEPCCDACQKAIEVRMLERVPSPASTGEVFQWVTGGRSVEDYDTTPICPFCDRNLNKEIFDKAPHGMQVSIGELLKDLFIGFERMGSEWKIVAKNDAGDYLATLNVGHSYFGGFLWKLLHNRFDEIQNDNNQDSA